MYGNEGGVVAFLKIDHELTEPTGPLEFDSDRLANLVGDLRLFVGGEVIYRDRDFPLAELAAQLESWTERVQVANESFAFGPLLPGLPVLFRILHGQGGWSVTSVQQELPSAVVYDLAHVLEEVRSFICRLEKEVDERHGFSVLGLRR